MIGCSKDDDKGSSASLVGTWKLTAEKYNGVPEVLDTCELKSTVTFTSTTFKAVDYDGENCDESYELEGTYTKNGNTLKIVTVFGTETVEISKLNNTTLEFTEVDGTDTSVITYTKI